MGMYIVLNIYNILNNYDKENKFNLFVTDKTKRKELSYS